MIGFKSKPKHYPYILKEYDIQSIGLIKYPQWTHPKESLKEVKLDVIKGYMSYIDKGDFCIDIGAHTGDTTLPMALAAGQTGCVVALEPNPYVFTILEKTSRTNPHLTNIKPIMAAVGAEEGFMTFEYSDSGFCNGGRHDNISSLKHGHHYKQEVFVIDLVKELKSDFYSVLPNLKFIKVDTEGYDLFVLQSMKEIISQYRPVIKTEVFKQTDDQYRIRLLKFFEELKYSVFLIDEEPLGKGVPLSNSNINIKKHYDILALPNH